MARYIWIILLLFCASAFGQGNHLGQIKRYDTTSVEATNPDYNAKNPTLGMDSTKFRINCWDDAWFEVDVINELLPFADHYDTSTIMGYPSATIGRAGVFDVYVQASERGFEWGAILYQKIPGNKSTFEFPFRSKGLRMEYQPPLTPEQLADSMDGIPRYYQPPGVGGSVAFFHHSGIDNVHRADGTHQLFGSGHAFSILRPYAFDADSDTVDCVLEIYVDSVISDITYGRVIIDVESSWLKFAAYPVNIDPDIGITDETSALSAGYDATLAHRLSANQYTASTGDVLNSISAYTRKHSTTADLRLAVFDVTASAPVNLFKADTITFGNNAAWHTTTPDMNAAMSNGVTYTATMGCPHNGASNYKLYYFSETAGATEKSGCVTDWSGASTVTTTPVIYFTYTAGGGSPDPSTRRRKVLLGAITPEADTGNPYTMSMFDEPIETEVTQ